MQKKPRPVPGDKFGRLTVEAVFIERNRNGSSRAYCECVCSCGKFWRGRHVVLVSGHTKSCGCLSAEAATTRATKHGGCGTRLYRVWKNMKMRCDNPKVAAYKDYGGRGICVCAEWNDFSIFRDWALAHGYGRSLFIDRENNDKDYRPDNCRFVTRQANNCNRRLLPASNTTGYCGVFKGYKGVYSMNVAYLNKLYYRGKFPTAEAAAKFRDALVVINGWPLPLNFPEMTLEEAQLLVGGNHPKGVRK